MHLHQSLIFSNQAVVTRLQQSLKPAGLTQAAVLPRTTMLVIHGLQQPLKPQTSTLLIWGWFLEPWTWRQGHPYAQ